MFRIERLKPEHIFLLKKEEANQDINNWLTSGTLQRLVEYPYSVSIFNNDLLCLSGGVVPYWEGRAHIWTVFSENARKNFLPVFRGIQTFLNYQPFKRVELSVPCSLEIGKRRAELLGFKLETECAKNYLPTGEDCALYSLIKDF